MMLIACTKCGLALQVEGNIKDENRELEFLVGKGSPWWPDAYPCPECDGKAMVLQPGQLTDRARVRLRTVDVTAQEAFAAFSGVGLPKERSCRLDDVSELLTKHGVKRIAGKDLTGTGRCILDYLELGDGSKVYLAPSTEGATVYRITRPYSYVEEVTRNG